MMQNLSKKPKSKRGQNLVNFLRMISNFDPDLYLMITYPFVKLKRN